MNNPYAFTSEQIHAALERVRQVLTDSLNAQRGTPEQAATHLLTGYKTDIRRAMATAFYEGAKDQAAEEKKLLQSREEAVPVRFGVEVRDWDTAFQLAQFVKRASFSTCLRLTDGGDANDQAYKMIDGLSSVRRGLDTAGISPR